MISAITPDGKLFLSMRTTSFDSGGVIKFLQELLSAIVGKLLIIWDGATIHRSNEIKAFLSEGATQRILLERLPAYAPDLNPDEGIWHYLKHVELGNVCCRNMADLQDKLTRATQRLAAKPELIQACFAQVGLYKFST